MSAVTAVNGRKPSAAVLTNHLRVVSDVELAPNRLHTFNMQDMPLSKFGRPAHIRYLKLTGTLSLNTVEADMPGAIGGMDLLKLVDEIEFKTAGHTHIEKLSASDLSVHNLVLSTSRTAAAIADAPAEVPNASATGLTRDISVYLILEQPEAPAGNRYDLCPPLRLFGRGTESDQSAFRLKVRRDHELLPGITVASTTGWTLDVGLVHLDEYNQPPPWRFAERPEASFVTVLESRGSWRFLGVWNEVQANTAADHSAYVVKGVTLGNEPLYEGQRTGAQIIDAAAHGLDYNHLFQSNAFRAAGPYLPIFVANPNDGRVTKMPSGPVRSEVVSRGAFSAERWMFWDTGLRTPDYDKAFRQAIGCPLSGPVVRVAARDGGGASMAAYLPSRLAWPDAPEDRVREKGVKNAQLAAGGQA